MKIIDAHIHLFNLADGDYHWLKPENPPLWPDKLIINKSFEQGDLKLDANDQLAGFVHIEAGFDNDQPWQEIEWLEKACSLPMKSIATCDLTLPPELFAVQLSRLRTYKSVVGVRHILDEDAPDLLAQKNVQINLNRIAKYKLIFELQINVSDLDSVTLFAKLAEQSALTYTINHAGFPPLDSDSDDWQNWLNGLALLAKNHAAIKCSGWEMLSRDYELALQKKVVHSCIKLFGIDKVMLASNFPLCLFSKEYAEFWRQIAEIEESEMQALVYNNARTWYQFTEL